MRVNKLGPSWPVSTARVWGELNLSLIKMAHGSDREVTQADQNDVNSQWSLLPRQSSLGLNFGFLFFSAFSHKSPSGLYSACVTNACETETYDTWNLQKLSSCKATSSDAMISRAMKSRTNEHTVRGRPTLKVVKRFRKGSVCKAYERSTIYKRTL